jgi:hypothetical protein
LCDPSLGVVAGYEDRDSVRHYAPSQESG